MTHQPDCEVTAAILPRQQVHLVVLRKLLAYNCVNLHESQQNIVFGKNSSGPFFILLLLFVLIS